MATINPVILSGGAGTRLWPLSRPHFPKQFIALTSGRTMLQETALRVSDPAVFAAPVVVCSDEHRFVVAEQMRAVGPAPAAIMLEPVARNTAPAIAAAADWLGGGDALMLVLPSDHVIRDTAAFRAAVNRAATAAEAGWLVTFGIAPDQPETGYGYIARGAALEGCDGAYKVARFTEKPDAETAARYLAQGDHAWNSGMFLFRADTYLAELERLQPAMAESCRRAVSAARGDLDFLRLDEAAFAACDSASIDYAVMEHTERAAVVPADLGWSDVGSWSALWDAVERDTDGNAAIGTVVAVDSHNNYLRADGPLIAGLGLEDMVVVTTADAVLVAPKNRAQEVRALYDALRAAGHDEADQHRKVFRPWGSYEGIDSGTGFQVKHITVKSGQKLSLQKHHHRAEHWIVVRGRARVTRDKESFVLEANQSTYIPVGAVHRLENIGDIPLDLIEVQSGDYLGEDDIERLEDQYGRS
ncbi:MAG: mannose-1-phosphate guanylyltransferase/mannose-6-phosphate isomerase [Proteobacteria bacterium]|nr:mannose-1-phosphate guanylyltransferase/mannose-6-phosphate isomerase [Pseudomonadota bacterium]